jgi:hypothetical protein
VKLSEQVKQPYVPSVETEQWLVNCLKNSPVRLVRIDPVIGERGLELWADTCHQAKKGLFLELPSTQELPRRKAHSVGRSSVGLTGACCLVTTTLSPLMLGLALLIHLYSPGSIFFKQWRVGERGKLFQISSFARW